MDTEDYEYSIASHLAYEFIEHNDAQKTQEELDTWLKDYKLIPELSNDFAVTIQRPTGSAILAYRGTNPDIFNHPITALNDFNADRQIAQGFSRGDEGTLLGVETRFTRAEKLYKDVKKQYERVDLTGHSLGGSTADYIGRKYDNPAVVFNPGESPLELLRFDRDRKYSDTKVYTTGTDPISYSTYIYKNQQEIQEVPQTDNTFLFGRHNLTNFLPPKNILPLKMTIDPKPYLEFQQPKVIHIKKNDNNLNKKILSNITPDKLNNLCDIEPEYFSRCRLHRVRIKDQNQIQ